jgi:hypothetical protein
VRETNGRLQDRTTNPDSVTSSHPQRYLTYLRCWSLVDGRLITISGPGSSPSTSRTMAIGNKIVEQTAGWGPELLGCSSCLANHWADLSIADGCRRPTVVHCCLERWGLESLEELGGRFAHPFFWAMVLTSVASLPRSISIFAFRFLTCFLFCFFTLCVACKPRASCLLQQWLSKSRIGF